MRHIPFYLMISTNSSPDHNNTHVSTKAALLGLMVLLDIAAIFQFQNAPDCSWIDPIERVMSLLNLGLQHCRYARKECASPDIETQVKGMNAMKVLRESSEDNNK